MGGEKDTVAGLSTTRRRALRHPFWISTSTSIEPKRRYSKLANGIEFESDTSSSATVFENMGRPKEVPVRVITLGDVTLGGVTWDSGNPESGTAEEDRSRTSCLKQFPTISQPRSGRRHGEYEFGVHVPPKVKLGREQEATSSLDFWLKVPENDPDADIEEGESSASIGKSVEGGQITTRDSSRKVGYTLQLSEKMLAQGPWTSPSRVQVVPIGDGAHAAVPSMIAWLIKNEKGQGGSTILVYPTPDLANLMKDIPDDTPWTELALTGTHDTTARYGAPFAQCQELGAVVKAQLEAGVRFLDLRMRVMSSKSEDGQDVEELIMYHGKVSQRDTFASVLSTISTFLLDHPSESLMIALKEEVPPLHPSFSVLVRDELSKYTHAFDHLTRPDDPSSSGNAGISTTGEKPDQFFLESRVPTLGETRGKAIIVSRFTQEPKDWGDQVGLHPEWRDNSKTGTDWKAQDGTLISIQDWYGLSTVLAIPEKERALRNHLAPSIAPLHSAPTRRNPRGFTAGHADTNGGSPADSDDDDDDDNRTKDCPRLSISYASAAKIPLAPPHWIAKGVGYPDWGLGVRGMNERTEKWLVELLAGAEGSLAYVGKSSKSHASASESKGTTRRSMGYKNARERLEKGDAKKGGKVEGASSPKVNGGMDGKQLQQQNQGKAEREGRELQVGTEEEAREAMRIRGIIPVDFCRPASENEGRDGVCELLAAMSVYGLSDRSAQSQ